MSPVVCLITDRRLHGGDTGTLVERLAAAARAGVHLIQIRERDLEAGALVDLVRRSVEAVRGTAARVLVNDRVDVALAAGAHGVHLRGDSVAASRVRRIVPPGFLIGRSVHTVGEAVRVRDDGSLDYLIFGTVFPTSSKPDRPGAGIASLTAVVAATPVPVLAVGGVTLQTAGLIARTGAAGVAAIGLFAEADADQLQRTVTSLARLFDTPRTVT